MIIDADEIKKEFKDYDPKNASQHHTESAKLADKRFEEALFSVASNTVILLCGGTASGKTEFISQFFSDSQDLIFDSTLSTPLALKNKWEKSKKHEKKLQIYFIIPESIESAYITFLNRDRKFSDKHFIKTHSQSRSVVLEALNRDRYQFVEVKIFISKPNDLQKLSYTELLGTREQKLEFIMHEQYTRQDIEEMIQNIHTSYGISNPSNSSQE